MNIFRKTANFIGEVKQELKNVSWSTREELIGSTFVIIVTTSLVAIYIGCIDILLSKVLSLILKLPLFPEIVMLSWPVSRLIKEKDLSLIHISEPTRPY